MEKPGQDRRAAVFVTLLVLQVFARQQFGPVVPDFEGFCKFEKLDQREALCMRTDGAEMSKRTPAAASESSDDDVPLHLLAKKPKAKKQEPESSDDDAPISASRNAPVETRCTTSSSRLWRDLVPVEMAAFRSLLASHTTDWLSLGPSLTHSLLCVAGALPALSAGQLPHPVLQRTPVLTRTPCVTLAHWICVLPCCSLIAASVVAGPQRPCSRAQCRARLHRT